MSALAPAEDSGRDIARNPVGSRQLVLRQPVRPRPILHCSKRPPGSAMTRSDLQSLPTSRTAIWAGAALLGAALTAAWVERRSRRAESDQPPAGRLLEIDGVRLHVVEKGEGPAVVLIHGNMVSERDFEASGLLDRLARNHRVIAFDRPG